MTGFVGRVDRLPKNPARTLELGARLSGPSERGDGPLVSVITVVYNNVATLQRCIDSVVAQRDVQVEYIVIDGGSTDGTTDVIRANAAQIDYAVSEPDRGIYDAMNKGIELAQGDYIALINSDDWLEPDGLKVSIDNIRANGAEVSIGFANVWKPDGEYSHVWQIGNFDARILTSGMSFCHQALIASRRAYDVVGPFDAKIRLSADYKWIKKLYLSELETVFTERPVVNFSFDGVSANNRSVWKAECKDLLTDQFSFFEKEDVSAFLEYVYRDGPLDRNAAANLIMQAAQSPLVLQSLGLVLLDKLTALELTDENVASASKRVQLGPPLRGALTAAGDGAPQERSERPKISVVIPVYNVENYLEQCVRSVMDQSLDEIEIICVNDGSPDGSQVILERLAAEDSRIKIIVKENGGLSSARNAGIRAAQGEFVHFLDSDDYINAGMYQRLFNYASENRLELVKSNLGFVDDVYPVKRPILPRKEFFQFTECPACVQFISPCTALYKKELLDRVDPFVEGMTYEDRPFNWETLIKARRIGHVDEVYYMYRVARPGSIMSTRKTSAKHFDAFKSMDRLRDMLARRGDLDKYRVEYVTEQLRVYSMLIDIDAIPRQFYGGFYWDVHRRLNAMAVALSQVLKSNLPHRVKALYAFFLDGAEDGRLRQEGERYFFHGLNYKTTSVKYSGSACELFMIAEQAIETAFTREKLSSVDSFRKAALIATMFDHIHATDAISVDDVREALGKLSDVFVAYNRDFRKVVSALHDPVDTADRASVDHICFQYSQAPNYGASRRFIEEYFDSRSESARFITFDDLRLVGVSNEFGEALQGVILAIKERGIRPYAFSQIVELRHYFNKQINIETIKSITILFPNSAPERYLFELLKDYCKIIFLPHGLPQVSNISMSPDIVFSLTKTEEWATAFPNSRIVHVGWPETAELAAPLTIRDKSLKTVLFLSQIEGSSVHKLDDFVVSANQFLQSALLLDPDFCEVDFRLRRCAELDLLDADLVAAARERGNIEFTIATERVMAELRPDLIVSATSTGMLYAQHFNVPLLQLYGERLYQHWPFQLTQENNRCSYSGESAEELAALAQDILDDQTSTDMYDVFSERDRFLVLDSVYKGFERKQASTLRPVSKLRETYNRRRIAESLRSAAYRSSAQSKHGETPTIVSSWSVSEQREFGDTKIVNILVRNLFAVGKFIKPFHFKLLRRKGRVGLELRKQDGGFELLGDPRDERVETDEWGQKLVLFVNRNGWWSGSTPSDVAADTSALEAFIAELPAGVASCASLDEDWRDAANHFSEASVLTKRRSKDGGAALSEHLSERLRSPAIDEAFGVPMVVRGNAQTKILVDEDFSTPAFYWLEQRGDDRKEFRWFGKKDQEQILVRFPKSKSFRIDVEIVVHVGDQALEGFKFGCGGQIATDYRTQLLDNGGVLKSAVFQDQRDRNDTIEVDLVSEWKKDLSFKGDLRTISVGIHQIVVTQVE